MYFRNMEKNTLNLTITKTIQTRDNKSPTPTPIIKKYRIIFTDWIIENVTALPLNEECFLLTIFTVDGQINQIQFDSLKTYTTSSGFFNKSMNINTVEYLNFFNSNFFALGSETGVIYLIKLENHKGNLKMEIVDEIKKSMLKEKISNLMNLKLNLNIFSNTKKSSQDSIKSIKHVGNNLLAYVTEEFNFKIYNYKTEREIYQNCLIKNRIDERLINCKINFHVLKFNEEDLRQSRSKCFIFSVYLEYNFTYILTSFEVWFANIPEINMDAIIRSETVGIIKDFNAFYEFIDLGQDVRIKNIRIYKLSGKLVDIINYDKKIWVLYENPHYNEGSTSEVSQNEMLKYNLKIFSINKLSLPSMMDGDFLDKNPILTEEPKIVFYDYQIKNLENILNQIKSYRNYNLSNLESEYSYIPKNNKKIIECLKMSFTDSIEIQLLYELLRCGDFVDEDILISYFNSKFCSGNHLSELAPQKFLNKTQVLYFIEKSCQNFQKYSKNKSDTNISSAGFLQKAIEDLIKISNENKINSLGFFVTKEIEGLSLIRKKGISFLKSGGDFEYINEIINSHEYYLRNLIFGSENINKYQSHNINVLTDLQSRIMNYLTLESKQSSENMLLIIFALLRIFLTEAYLLINDEKYLYNYFVNNSSYSEYNIDFMEAFVKEHFDFNIENQFNNLNYLDVIHQVIYNTYLNNKGYIDEHVQKVLENIRKYKEESNDGIVEIIEAENYRGNMNIYMDSMASQIRTEKFNSKFIEILAKLTFGKIQAFFNISRDLTALLSWMKKYFKNPIAVNVNYLNMNERHNPAHFNLLSLKEKIEANFYETSSCLILASHKCKISLIQSSIINNVCFVEKGYSHNNTIPYQTNSNDFEVNFVQLTIYENLYKFGQNIFRDVENKYVDYIIRNIWTNYISFNSRDENVRRRLNFEKRNNYYIFERLFLMKEYKLISLLLKLQNDSRLKNIFFGIICQGYIGDMTRMKDYLNKYFSILIDISNASVPNEFFELEEFYSNFSKNLANKDIRSISANEINKFRNNYVIAGFYYVEEQMKHILSDEMKYEFYFHCYSFIYPTVSGLGSSITSEESNKIQEFLINMLKSCIDIDIDLALSCYSTIIKNFKSLNSNSDIIGIFVNYLVKSPDNISFCKKLITQESEFINNICQNLEMRCEKLKDNTKILYLLKFDLRLETESVVLQIAAGERENINSSYSMNSQYVLDLERNVNYFSILFSIYSLMKDYEKAAKIYYSYSEAISDVIKMNAFNLTDLKKVYLELNTVIFNITNCLNQLSNPVKASKSNVTFLHRDITHSDYSVNFITKEGLIKENKLINSKIDLLSYFIRNESRLINSGLKIEEYNNIRCVNGLLNYLFKYQLYSIVLDCELITALDNNSAKKLIINFIKVMISKSYRYISNSRNENDMSIDDENTGHYIALNIPNTGHSNLYDNMLASFIQQIVETKRVEFIMNAIDCLLYANANLNLDVNLPDLLV